MLENIMRRFYIEPYVNGWSVWDRTTNRNNGYVYPTKEEAMAVADASEAAGQFIEKDWN